LQKELAVLRYLKTLLRIAREVRKLVNRSEKDEGGAIRDDLSQRHEGEYSRSVASAASLNTMLEDTPLL